MYKAKSNSTQRIVKKSSLLTIIIVSVVFLQSAPFANANFSKTLSIDSLLQPLTQHGDNKLPTPNVQQSDRFLHILAQKNTTTQQSHKTSIQQLRTQLTNASCNLSTSDITTILTNHHAFNNTLVRDFNLPFHTQISPTSTTATPTDHTRRLRSACSEYLRCHGSIANNQELQLQDITTCVNTLFVTYTNNRNLIAQSTSISHINQQDHIYMDGDKENSSFDLMIDMNRIKDLLFESSTTPEMPQMIYYTLPSSYHNAGAGSTPGGNNGAINPSSPIGSPTITNPDTNPITNNPPGGSQGGNPIQDFINEIGGQINPTNPNPPTTTTPVGTTTTLIQPSICLPGEQIIVDNQETPWEDVIIDTTPTSGQQNELDDIINTINTQLSGFITNPANPFFGVNNLGNFISTNNTSGLPEASQLCTNECIDTEGGDLGRMICEGKCCVRNCNNLSDPIQKALCLSSCICGEIRVPEDPDILRIRICRVPAQVSRIKAGKKITSIEEAVDEINNIFNTLKNNGLLTKRTKTKEFMDSSFSSIKFHQILAFDIFVAVKPIYDVIQIAQRQETNSRDIKKINSINGMSSKPFVGSDKNKYNLARSSSAPLRINEITYDTKKQQEILQSLKKEQQSSMINDQLFIFAQEHYQLREQISQYIIGDMSQVAKILSTKAQNAK